MGRLWYVFYGLVIGLIVSPIVIAIGAIVYLIIQAI
jgi:tetrahydromethanopterin S-methyltransferase subunit G